MRSSTETLIAAMRVLARDIQSGDGVANAAISEAADRLEELHADHLRDATKMVEQQARIAETAPFAWATFDGEGSYDLRLYECNESYRDEWLAANGRLYADWVIPLYEAPDELRGRIAELERQAAIGRPAVDAWDALAALVGEIDDLIDESGGVYGLHLNGDPAPWSEILQGGRFERLCSLSDARRLLAGGE